MLQTQLSTSADRPTHTLLPERALVSLLAVLAAGDTSAAFAWLPRFTAIFPRRINLASRFTHAPLSTRVAPGTTEHISRRTTRSLSPKRALVSLLAALAAGDMCAVAWNLCLRATAFFSCWHHTLAARFTHAPLSTHEVLQTQLSTSADRPTLFLQSVAFYLLHLWLSLLYLA